MNNNYHHVPATKNKADEAEKEIIERMNDSSSNYVRPPLLSEMIRDSLQKEDLLSDDVDDEKRAQEFYDMLKAFDATRDPIPQLEPLDSTIESKPKHDDSKNNTLFVLEEENLFKEEDGESLDELSDNGLTVLEEMEIQMMMVEDPKELKPPSPKMFEEPQSSKSIKEVATVATGRTLADDARDLCIRPASFRQKSIILDPDSKEEPLSGGSKNKNKKDIEKRKSMRRKSSIMSFDSNYSSSYSEQGSNSITATTVPKMLTLLPPSAESRLYYGPAAHFATSVPKWRYNNKPANLLFTTNEIDIRENRGHGSYGISDFVSKSSSRGGGGGEHSSLLSLSSAHSSLYSYVSAHSSQHQSNSSCSKAVVSSVFSSPHSLRRRLVRKKVGSSSDLSPEHRIAIRESAIRAMSNQPYRRQQFS